MWELYLSILRREDQHETMARIKDLMLIPLTTRTSWIYEVQKLLNALKATYKIQSQAPKLK